MSNYFEYRDRPVPEDFVVLADFMRDRPVLTPVDRDVFIRDHAWRVNSCISWFSAAAWLFSYGNLKIDFGYGPRTTSVTEICEIFSAGYRFHINPRSYLLVPLVRNLDDARLWAALRACVLRLLTDGEYPLLPRRSPKLELEIV